MWISAHETWKQFLMRHVSEWAASQRMSKFTAVDEIIVAHKRIGGPQHSGAYFEPSSKDEYNRLKANCTTFFRYAEETDEEKNIFDLLPSILAAMPMEQRLSFVSQYLRPAGLAVRPVDDDSDEGLNMEVVCDTQNAAYDAMRAMTTATLHPTAENLEIAEREAIKATEKFRRTRRFLTAARNACKGAKAAIAKVCHRKESA